MAKQDWLVTLRFTETEGGADTIEPWYTPQDILALVLARLRQLGPIRDLVLAASEAKPDGSTYL